MSETDVLIFGPDKDMILFFVTKNFHEFSFVFWATIDLARNFFPNVNQFFESLYMVHAYFQPLLCWAFKTSGRACHQAFSPTELLPSG